MAKVESLLKDIENRELVLPEFQRDYVWKEDDVKKFIQSIYKNYPTGSLLIWKTIVPPKLRGVHKTNEVGYTKVILDGQQRLTTLYFLLKNQSPPYYENRQFNFNLWFNVESEEFRYYQKTIMDGKREWISVRKFFEFKEVATFIDSFELEETQKYYFKWKGPLMKLSGIKDYDYHVDEDKLTRIENIKEIVKIFNLVNRQGRTLVEEDLALATISVFWPELKDLLRAEIELLQQRNFKSFDFNFFVLCINCVATGHAKFDNLLNENISDDKIKEAWDKVKRSTEYLINILHDKAYINSDQLYELKSKALLVPIITYLARNDIEFQNEDELKKFLYWFYAAMMWGRYTRRGKSSPLEQDIVSITKDNKPESLIYNLKREVRNFEVSSKELEGAGVTSPFFNMAFVLAKHNGAVDWFNGNRLHSNLLGNSYKLHKHHIFPKDRMKKKGYNDREKMKLVNEIANRAFLTERANKQILAQKSSIYLKKVLEKYPKSLDQQLVSTKEVLWDEDNFMDFLKDRRARIAKGINHFMESLIKKDIPDVKIGDLIKSEESFNLELKSSFAFDVKEDKENKELRNSVLKEIIAFMNSGGGTLIIGVNDEHKVIGLEKDYELTHKGNKDGFIQEFTQFVESGIGGFNNFKRCVEIEFHKIDGKDILEVRVDKSTNPIFLKLNGLKTLYVRDENRVIPVSDAEEVNNYITDNWQTD